MKIIDEMVEFFPQNYKSRVYQSRLVMVFDVKYVGMPSFTAVDWVKDHTGIDVLEYASENEILSMLEYSWQEQADFLMEDINSEGMMPRMYAWGRSGGWWGWDEVEPSIFKWNKDDNIFGMYAKVYKWLAALPDRVYDCGKSLDDEFYGNEILRHLYYQGLHYQGKVKTMQPLMEYCESLELV